MLAGGGLLFLAAGLQLLEKDTVRPGAPSLVAWRAPEGADDAARLQNKPVLYDFTAEWCGPCRKMEAEVFSSPRVASRLNSQFICVRVLDRRAEEGKNPRAVDELQLKYQVDGFPTVVVVSPSGQLVNSFTGYRSRERVERFLDGVLESLARDSR